MNLSIQMRFNLIASAVVIAVLLAFSAYNQSETRKSLRAALDNQANAAIERLSNSVPVMLWNYESEQLLSVTTSEIKSDALLRIFIFDNESLQLGLKSEANGEIAKATQEEFNALIPEQTMSADLMFNDSGSVQSVGKVIIEIDEHSIDKALDDAFYRAMLQLVLLVAILLSTITFLLKRVVISPLEKVGDALLDISQGEGDLTQRLDVTSDEIGLLASHFNRFVEKIQNLLTQVISSVNDMNHLVGDLVDVSENTNAGVARQNVETDQAATAITQMAASAKEVASNASGAADAAQSADVDARNAQSVLTRTIDAIDKLVAEVGFKCRG